MSLEEIALSKVSKRGFSRLTSFSFSAFRSIGFCSFSKARRAEEICVRFSSLISPDRASFSLTTFPASESACSTVSKSVAISLTRALACS